MNPRAILHAYKAGQLSTGQALAAIGHAEEGPPQISRSTLARHLPPGQKPRWRIRTIDGLDS